MKFFHQFYFILYKYFLERSKYIDSSIKRSPQKNASLVVGVSFVGWILLAYFIIITMFDFQNFDKKYGKFVVVALGLLFIGLIGAYFDNNHETLFLKYTNATPRKSKIIIFATLFFVTPFVLLIFFLI
jgi:hypothetical protein